MATNTAASFTNHTGNATAGPFSISFSYLDEDEIDVTVGGVLKTKTTHYTFPSATTISFTSGNHPANGVAIKFQRDTDISAKKVDFQDGSVLTEADLDNNSNQILYGLQEHLDITLNDLFYRDGSKTFSTGNLVFEGATDDAHETTLVITDPTADRTITLPNTTGTVVTTGDTGSINSTMLAANSITTNNIADNAITSAKIADFKSVQTTISDTDDSYPTSGAVVDYIAAQIAPLGGVSTFSEAFDGSRTQFTLSNAPTYDRQIILSLNGVIQKPGTAFTLSDSTVTLASAPPSGTDYFAIVTAATKNIGTPGPNTIATSNLQDGAVTGAKIATNLDLIDNKKIRFGTGNDLEIFHDGSNSYINETGTGNLHIRSTSLVLETETGSDASGVAGEQIVWKSPSGNIGKIDTVSGGSGGADGHGGELRFYTKQDNSANLPERMRINNDGDLFVQRIYDNTTSGGANVRVQSNGLLQRDTSSRRYKNTIEDATHGLTELKKLRSVTYKGNNDGDTIFGGLIAEEVHDAGLTEFVDYNSDNQPDALRYANMVALCIKTIQELSTKVETLETKVATLEAK